MSWILNATLDENMRTNLDVADHKPNPAFQHFENVSDTSAIRQIATDMSWIGFSRENQHDAEAMQKQFQKKGITSEIMVRTTTGVDLCVLSIAPQHFVIPENRKELLKTLQQDFNVQGLALNGRFLEANTTAVS